MGIQSFMSSNGQEYELIRDGMVRCKIKGLPNHESGTRRPYIGFYANTDIQEDDSLKSCISGEMFFIEEVRSQVIKNKVFQVQAFYLTEFQLKKNQQNRHISNGSNIIYNLNGINSKVNYQSTDHSVNQITTSESDIFNEIKKILEDSLNNATEMKVMTGLLDEMKAKQNTVEFNSLYTRFISTASDHLSLISPFLPALSKMIQG